MNNLIADIKKFYQEILDNLDYLCLLYPDFPVTVELLMWIMIGIFITIAVCLIGSYE